MASSEHSRPAQRRQANERAIYRQLREQDMAFGDATPSPHQLVAVVFDSDLSETGDLTRRIRVILRLGDLQGGTPEYRWRIPHPPRRPPFALDIRVLPNPLAYRIEQAEISTDVACTTVVFDLRDCAAGRIIELAFSYSLENSIDITRRGLFATSHTFVWTYTFVSHTNYFETKLGFPRGASLSVDSNETSLHAFERTAEIDGRAVYSYTSWEPRQGQTISGCVTYRIWSSAIEPVIAIAGGAVIAIPAAFATNVLTGVITFGLAALVTGFAQSMIGRLK
ncbi:hypothetical protein [Nocardia gamkensis]|uniref:Uncharacterized protein n=1 Tax=Nocardia gamkensis TaxID=352869 RepID=A0A7X6L6Q9_9NOCA|nr:hypothetical protein [Nocardia gamkensis]NKY28595.1 hypothetical protein [Nocardia gamkensis]NQE71251.1 hypothetical protein [Nocardia gamkensis]